MTSTESLTKNADPLDTLGNVTAHTRRVAAQTIAALEAATDQTVKNTWGYDPDKSNTEHHSGKAVDFMCTKAGGDWLANYLWAHRGAFGLTHLIWQQRIRSTVVDPGQWRAMEDRGGPTANHMDHVHALFGRIPAAATTPRVDTPRAPAYPLRAGRYFGPRSITSSRYLATWQRQMVRRGWTLKVDGLYGPQTAAVTRAFQKEKRLKVDAKIGPKTWAAAWTAPIT